MTHNEQTPDGPTEWPRAYLEIDALLDGEPVDKHVLRSALEDSAARDYLVDALLLRQLTRDMEPTHFVAPATPRGPLVRGVRWLAAGLILVVGTGIGYVQGQRSNPPLTSPGAVEVVLENRPAPPPPAPTRLIRFEPGVNWTTDTRSR
jgi:hypothetical protein